MLIAQNKGAGQNMGMPDVCLTTAGPAVVPIPYPNIGMNAQASSFAMKVMIKAMNALNLASQIAMTSGDEAGTSHWTIMGMGMFTKGDLKTFFEGTPGITVTSMGMANKGNCPMSIASVPSVSNVFLTQRSPTMTPLAVLDAKARARHEQVTDHAALELVEHEGGVAAIRIPAFARNVPSRLFTLLRDSPRALVLDLRGNPGGDMDMMLEVADDFLPRGAHMMTLRGEDDDEDRRVGRHAQRYEMPLAIVVDGETASAAEVFAGILQSHGRSTVIGSTTYGKGTVQRFNAIPREEGSELANVGLCELHDGRRMPVEPDVIGGFDDATTLLCRSSRRTAP